MINKNRNWFENKLSHVVSYWGLLGALFGFIDGVLISMIYHHQLNRVVQKISYIILSLNFHGVLGLIVGFVSGSFLILSREGRLKRFLILMQFLFFAFIYGGFYFNVFRLNLNQPMHRILELKHLIETLIIVIPAGLLAYILYLVFNRSASRIRLKFGTTLLLIGIAVIVNAFLWFGLSKDIKSSAHTSQVNIKKKSVKDTFILPSDYTPPKNLIIIIIDALRADHLGCYGYSRNTSPFIDELARTGVHFDNVYVQRPKTSPSIASLFTSLYVHEHGIVSCATVLPDEYFTLSESYQEHGYTTGSIVANKNVSSEFNYDQGFMTSINTSDLVSRGLAVDLNQGVYLAAVQWLEKNWEKPFFLYLHFLDPHNPYTPPKDFDVFISDLSSSTLIDFEDIPKNSLLGSHNELEYYIAKYDGEILYSDFLVKKVFEKLTELNILEDTLIIITADHGHSLGDHRYFFAHGLFCYDACARVPFIIYYNKRVFSAKRINQTIEMIDVYPSVHELMRLNYDADLIHGTSFVPLLLNYHCDIKIAFLESGKSNQYNLFYSIRDKRWKLICNYYLPTTQQLLSPHFMFNLNHRLRSIMSTGYYSKYHNYELYDILDDPNETNNLYYDNPDVASRIKKMLEKKIKIQRKFRQENKLEEFKKETIEQLKSLGYIK